jgi:putative endonuclease
MAGVDSLSPGPSPRGGGGWYVYILRCADDTLYTGVTTDPERRLHEHNAGGKLGARYTRARLPVVLAWQEPAASKVEAYRREAAIKKLSRIAKMALTGSPDAAQRNSGNFIGTPPDSAVAASGLPN